MILPIEKGDVVIFEGQIGIVIGKPDAFRSLILTRQGKTEMDDWNLRAVREKEELKQIVAKLIKES